MRRSMPCALATAAIVWTASLLAGCQSAPVPPVAGLGAPLSPGYPERVRVALRQHLAASDALLASMRNVPGAAANVEIRTDANGGVASRRLQRSSGFPAWDDAVLRAVDRAGSLPPDTNGRVPALLWLTVAPFDRAEMPTAIGVVCPVLMRPELPREALHKNISGKVVAEARIVQGRVVEVTILTPPSIFDAAVVTAMRQYRCTPSAAEITAQQSFDFRIEP